MTADLQDAVAAFCREHSSLLLVVDPKRFDAFEVAAFVFGDAANKFLDGECVKAMTSRVLDKLFVLFGQPFGRLVMTRSGRPAAAMEWFDEIAQWCARRKVSPGILALVSQANADGVDRVIQTVAQEDRWAKFRV